MEGKHLVITCTLTVNNEKIPTHALINCGATGIAFMDQYFARHHQMPLQELKEKRQIEVIDVRPIESGDITHVAKFGMMIQDHKEQLPMCVTKLGHYPIVLGIPSVTIAWCCSTICIHYRYFRITILYNTLSQCTRCSTRSYRRTTRASLRSWGDIWTTVTPSTTFSREHCYAQWIFIFWNS